MSKLSTEVLIVGAGPAGLATAVSLAQAGVKFVIVDALPEAQNTSRAAVIHAATLQSLGKLGVADQLICQGIKVPHFRVRERDAVLFHGDFSSLPGPWPYALMIPQDETEAILINRLAKLGQRIIRPARLSGFESTNEGVRATVDGPDGSVVVEARYIVGSDGEKSTVRCCAGIPFPGHTYGSFLLADVRMDWPLPKSEVTLFFAEGGVLVVVPMSNERYRVVAQLENAPSEPAIGDVQRIINERGLSSGAMVHDLLWGSRFQVHHKLADQFRAGPVLLVGDAAHVHSPAGGQGMNLGLRDAVALGDCLANVLGSAHDADLDRYAAERRTAARKVLAMTARLTRIATLQAPALRWTRNLVLACAGSLPMARRAVAARIAGLA
ncbi:FAD-dependent monooxygenase [Pusillimonas sp.]|uniref:FAD-dependent monooxygenase n=1 Tax=Pusillimonas sp. TaxID=3040095 RepID=UPI0037C82425